jgi:NADH:ubiquinone oxidoreductase subunit 2 (subunit N)
MLFLTTVTKTVIFFFLTFLYYYIFFKFSYSFKAIFIISCLGSMIIGALGAFKEMKIKNFISYASINQVGFILIGLSCYTELSISYSIFYFFIYIILTLGFFNFLINIQENFTQKNLNYFSDIKLFYKKNILLTFLFSFYILSFAGLPPFSGFFGKLNLYYALLKSENFLMLLLILFINLISLYYYIKIVKII